MSIDNELLKEFAQITNDTQTKKENTYLRGTIVSNSGSKYVQIDGSSTATPITETVNVEEGDRVLVSIENHKATIVGNFTFPPSARKEQEALDKSETAQETANTAQTKAQEASNKADTAINQSSIASASADEAKQQANDAIAAANTASTNASEAKSLATKASTDAGEAKTQAAESQAASANAQAEVTKLQNEVKDAQEDADKALADLETQAGEITAIKETYATKVEVGNTKAELETTITTKVGELATTVSQTYSTKTENVQLEEKLQTQITQNSETISTHVTKIEELESDTTKAQEDVADALSKAAAAQTAATNAQNKADAAQAAADTAQQAANTADQKAATAKNAADLAQQAADAADEAVQAAQSDLNEAKENLANVTSRVDVTETDIAEAQSKVDKAQTDVNNALADAAEANLAATKAQQAADKAQEDAETAQGAANTAQQKADNAQTAADNAQEAANKAQADVAALTSRVTTAETTISQNSENITLNATKITEIGEQADATDTNLTNNYYTKTETDAKIQIESDRITSTVSKIEEVEIKADNAQEDIDSLSVGGRNLFLNSELAYPFGTLSSDNESTDKLITIVDTGAVEETIPITDEMLSLPIEDFDTKIDEDLAFSLDVKVTGSFTNLRFSFDVRRILNVWTEPIITIPDDCDKNIWFRVSGVDTIVRADTFNKPTNAFIRIAWDNAEIGSTVEYRLPKLELGNKATDWTPAPEDTSDIISKVEDSIDTRLDEVNTSIQKSQSTIDQLSDMISHLVTDGNGQSLMTQTPDGWTFNMSSINDNLTTIKNTMSNMENNDEETNSALERLTNLVNDVVNKTAYIIMSTDENGDPCIELGKSDNPFKVRITNTAIDFLEGTTKIAYANNNTFYTEKMIVKNELQIGEIIGFVWKTRPNGNLGLSPIKVKV